MTLFRIHLVAGARPNFVKIAPLYKVLSKETGFQVEIVHTGQHYDPELNESVWSDLKLPTPHYFLEVGGEGPSTQTARVIERYSKVLIQHRPDLVIVVGDVTSTFAACLAAKQLGIKVAHLEAGLRSFDKTMPEEINRVLTDSIADYLWTPSEEANRNLIREGREPKDIRLVGNIMIDSLCLLEPEIDRHPILEELKLSPRQYALMTLHRPSNVDSMETLEKIVAVAEKLSKHLPIVFPVHPRTEKNLKAMSRKHSQVMFIKPLGYTAFSRLLKNAEWAATDSGGVQEETSYRGVPCFTLRENTERPITVTEGTNRLATIESLEGLVQEQASLRRKTSIPLWDGNTASRVCEEIKRISH